VLNQALQTLLIQECDEAHNNDRETQTGVNKVASLFDSHANGMEALFLTWVAHKSFTCVK